MPFGMAALPPNSRTLLWSYFRTKEAREPIKILSLFCQKIVILAFAPFEQEEIKITIIPTVALTYDSFDNIIRIGFKRKG